MVQLVIDPLLVLHVPTAEPPVAAEYAETVYFVIAAPFSTAGDQLTFSPPGVPETETLAGAPGTVFGTALTRQEGPEVPCAFEATTSTKYVRPIAAGKEHDRSPPPAVQLAMALPPTEASYAVAV